ncbi:hypothetical protein RQP46_010197 [Phenoliferia psychrophenolica]
MRAPTALFALLTSASLAASSSPLAAWTYPLGLLKMADMNGPLDSFSKDPGTVMFMPSFHTCDTAVATHLAMLPASPAQHLVILTSLSPSSLQTLFDVAGGGSPRPSSPKSPSTDFPERRHRGFLGLVRATFKIFFWMAILVAVPYVGYKLWMERKMRKDRGIMLPLTNDDDLDLEAE